MAHVWVVEVRYRGQLGGPWGQWHPYVGGIVSISTRRNGARSVAVYLRGCVAPSTSGYRVRRYDRRGA